MVWCSVPDFNKYCLVDATLWFQFVYYEGNYSQGDKHDGYIPLSVTFYWDAASLPVIGHVLPAYSSLAAVVNHSPLSGELCGGKMGIA